MIPIQDAVPSGKTPVVTIALIVINAAWFAAQSWVSLSSVALLFAPFTHVSGVHFVMNIAFLWLFGDNTEARLGRFLFFGLYLVCGALGTYTASALTEGMPAMFVGAASAVSGVLGAYFVLLPKSRVLVLVPLPTLLTEAPAPFFLGLWWLVHFATFVLVPGAAVALLWSQAVAFAAGAATCLIARRPVVWT